MGQSTTSVCGTSTAMTIPGVAAVAAGPMGGAAAAVAAAGIAIVSVMTVAVLALAGALGHGRYRAVMVTALSVLANMIVAFMDEGITTSRMAGQAVRAGPAGTVAAILLVLPGVGAPGRHFQEPVVTLMVLQLRGLVIAGPAATVNHLTELCARAECLCLSKLTLKWKSKNTTRASIRSTNLRQSVTLGRSHSRSESELAVTSRCAKSDSDLLVEGLVAELRAEIQVLWADGREMCSLPARREMALRTLLSRLVADHNAEWLSALRVRDAAACMGADCGCARTSRGGCLWGG